MSLFERLFDKSRYIARQLIPNRILLNPVIRSIFFFVLELPLFQLYMLGPSFIGWEGKSVDEICAALTGVASSHWVAQPEICLQLIERKFESILVVVYFMMYMCFLKLAASRLKKTGKKLYKTYQRRREHKISGV